MKPKSEFFAMDIPGAEPVDDAFLASFIEAAEKEAVSAIIEAVNKSVQDADKARSWYLR